MHDISPANGENVDDPDPVFHLPGLFWLVRLSDDEWQQVDDNTWRLDIEGLPETDRFQILGPGDVKMHLDLHSTYTRTPGAPTIITPQTSDPTSPFNWAGVVWAGSATSRFTATADDGSWSVSGTMDHAHSTELDTNGQVVSGHVMHERNGVFASRRVVR